MGFAPSGPRVLPAVPQQQEGLAQFASGIESILSKAKEQRDFTKGTEEFEDIIKRNTDEEGNVTLQHFPNRFYLFRYSLNTGVLKRKLPKNAGLWGSEDVTNGRVREICNQYKGSSIVYGIFTGSGEGKDYIAPPEDNGILPPLLIIPEGLADEVLNFCKEEPGNTLAFYQAIALPEHKEGINHLQRFTRELHIYNTTTDPKEIHFEL